MKFYQFVAVLFIAVVGYAGISSAHAADTKLAPAPAPAKTTVEPAKAPAADKLWTKEDVEVFCKKKKKAEKCLKSHQKFIGKKEKNDKQIAKIAKLKKKQ